jgi:hypothetical protein
VWGFGGWAPPPTPQSPIPNPQSPSEIIPYINKINDKKYYKNINNLVK